MSKDIAPKKATAKKITVSTPTVMPDRPGPVLIGDPSHPTSRPASAATSAAESPAPATSIVKE